MGLPGGLESQRDCSAVGAKPRRPDAAVGMAWLGELDVTLHAMDQQLGEQRANPGQGV